MVCGVWKKGRGLGGGEGCGGEVFFKKKKQLPGTETEEDETISKRGNKMRDEVKIGCCLWDNGFQSFSACRFRESWLLFLGATSLGEKNIFCSVDYNGSCLSISLYHSVDISIVSFWNYWFKMSLPLLVLALCWL